MAAVNFQKQTARNLVLSANSQVAYGGVLADAALTRRASVDASTVFTPSTKSYSDQGAVGHGTDFATAYVITAWNTMATVKGMGAVDSWLLGWMFALICGQEVATGSAVPYTHLFSIPNLSSLAPCTTCYVEDTDDVLRKYTDMAAKTLSIDIPERGPIQATLDMVGTGNFTPGAMNALPAVPELNYLLGSDVIVTITPQGGDATPMSGRQTGISIKIDRNSAAFESSGDGLRAGSVQYGKFGMSVDLTIMADATSDVNAWFEAGTPLAITIATNPALTYQFSIAFPMALIKANKLGNKADLVAWQLQFDQSSVLQVGNTAAFSAQIINECAAYLVPA